MAYRFVENGVAVLLHRVQKRNREGHSLRIFALQSAVHGGHDFVAVFLSPVDEALRRCPTFDSHCRIG